MNGQVDCSLPILLAGKHCVEEACVSIAEFLGWCFFVSAFVSYILLPQWGQIRVDNKDAGEGDFSNLGVIYRA